MGRRTILTAEDLAVISHRISGMSQMDAYCLGKGLNKDRVNNRSLTLFFNSDLVKHKMHELQGINSIFISQNQLLKHYAELFKNASATYIDDKGIKRIVDGATARQTLDSIAKHIGFFEMDNKQKGEVTKLLDAISASSGLKRLRPTNDIEVEAEFNMVGDNNE